MSVRRSAPPIAATGHSPLAMVLAAGMQRQQTRTPAATGHAAEQGIFMVDVYITPSLKRLNQFIAPWYNDGLTKHFVYLEADSEGDLVVSNENAPPGSLYFTGKPRMMRGDPSPIYEADYIGNPIDSEASTHFDIPELYRRDTRRATLRINKDPVSRNTFYELSYYAPGE